MKINAFTRKSHRWNEDRFIYGDNYWIVIDGATPLIKTKEVNLARLMVAYIKKNINKNITKRTVFIFKIFNPITIRINTLIPYITPIK